MNTAPLLSHLDALDASSAPLDRLLEAAVQGLHELDPRFHWTGIYELFTADDIHNYFWKARPVRA